MRLHYDLRKHALHVFLYIVEIVLVTDLLMTGPSWVPRS